MNKEDALPTLKRILGDSDIVHSDLLMLVRDYGNDKIEDDMVLYFLRKVIEKCHKIIDSIEENFRETI